jgi:predicted ester cyclase
MRAVPRPSPWASGRPQPNHHRGGTLSTEANKALVRRYFEERWNARNYDIVDELTATGDPEEHKAWLRSAHAVFSEYQLSFGEPLAEGDQVVLPWTSTGVLRSPYEAVGSPGERVEFSGLAMTRIADGKIIEDRAYSEGFGSVILGQTYQPG